jgi:fibronectin-binding autotransporter adhesin
VAVTLVGTASKAVMLAYRGASAIDTVSGFTTATAATSVATGLTGNAFANELEVSIFVSGSTAGTWTAPALTTSRINSSPTASINGMLIVDETQAAAGNSTSRTGTITGAHTLSAVAFSIIPSGRYWVGGTGTWSTATTNWAFTSSGASGAPAPTINDNVFFDQAGTYTVTLTGALTCFDMTVSAGTVTFTSTGTITNSGSISLIAGTVWSATGLLTFNSTSTSRTITTNAVTINSPITFAGVGGAWSLGSTLTTGTTVTTTLTNGTLTLNGFDLTTGSFSSSNTNTRVITWGTNSIYLTNTTAAQTVLDMAVLTNYSFSGTPAFVSDASVTRTYVFGTTGGTSANSPNLSFTGSGTAVQTFTTGSWFGILNFGTTAFNPGTTTLNLDALTLSSGGTFTGLTVTMVASGTITSNTNTTLGALTITTGTTTLGDTFSLSATSTVTLTTGTLDLNGFNLTTGIFSSNNSNTRSIAFGTNNIILSHTTAAQTVLSMATVTGFTYTGTGGFTPDASVTRTYTFGTTGGTSANSPNLSLTGSGTAVQTFTTGSWFGLLNFGTTAFNPGTTNLNLDSLVLSSGGTFSGLTATMVSLGGAIISNTNATLGALTITTGTIFLGDALTTVSTGTVTLTSGTLNLNGFDLTTGIFSSNNSNTRVITFGSNFIYLVHTTAAQTVLNLGNTNLTWTGTGGFSTQMTVTRTFTTGGTPTSSIGGVNLFITSGASAITFTGGGWYSILDFTGSTSTASLSNASNVNVTNLILASGGTYTALGVTTYNTGTITTNGKTIDDFTSGSSAYTLLPTVTTLAGPITCTRFDTSLTGTHTLDFASYNLTSSGLFVYNIGTLSNIATITCTTFTVNAGSFELTQGTITPSVSFTITGGGSFTYTGGTLSAVPTFTQTLGNVTLNQAYSLTSTGAYTLTSGTLTLNSYTLTTGTFSASNTNTRAIAFGTGQITATGTGTVWDTGTITSLTITGTPVVNVTNATATATTVNSGALPEGTAISFNFTAGTYALTFLGTSGYTANDVNFTGFAGTLGATSSCTIYGNYTLSSGMTVTASASSLRFGATSGTKTITSNNKTLPAMSINGTGGTFILGDNLTTSGIINVLAGTFNTTTNNYSINCAALYSYNGAPIRSITLNDSNVTITNTGGLQLDTQNLTFDAGTSQITLTNSVSSVITITSVDGAALGSLTFYDVSYTGGGAITIQGEVLTYNNLTFTNGSTTPASAAFTGTQTINGTLSSISTNASTRLIIQSLVSGQQVIISAGAISLVDIDFQDIYADGAVIPWSGTRLGNLSDNTNITFVAGTTKYWSLAAGGNWNAIAWATTSGGTPAVGNFPLPQDTCIIENTGLNTSGTITINSNWGIGTLDMSTRTNAMALAIGTSSPTISGNWINGSGTSITGTGVVNFIPDIDTISNITSAGKTFTCPIQVNSAGGTFKLLDALDMGVTNTFTLTQGTLTLNGYNLTTGIFSSNSNDTRLIEFGTNNIILSHTTAATVVLDMADTTNFNCTGTGGFTSGMSVTRSFTCGTIASVGGSILFNGSNQYLSHATATAYNFGYGNFTVEGWVYLDSYTFNNALFTVQDTNNTSGTGSYVFFVQAGNGRLAVTLSSTSYLTSTGPIVPLNQWCHIAFVRTNATNSITVWLNGTESVSIPVTSSTFNFSGGGDIRVGRGRGSSTNYFDGYITNLRVVKGVGVYTGSFVPSTYPLSATQPADTNISAITGKQTSLLLLTPNNTNYLKDSSTYNGTMINNAAATKNALTPFTDFPVAGIPPNLAINSGASIPTFTTNSSFGTLDFTGSTTTPATSTLNITTALTLPTTGTYTALSINMIGASTSTITSSSKTIAALVYTKGSTTISGTLLCTTFTVTGGSSNLSSGTLTPSTSITITGGSFTYSGTGSLGSVATFTHTAGTIVFSKSYSLTTTGTYTFTAGTLTIDDGLTLGTGIFSSSSTSTRSIAFGSASAGNINLTHTTAATTVLSMAILTGFSYTGPGGFTVAAMAVTRTFTCGTTGGTSSIAPNLTFTSGASIATITTGSWFNKLDYGTTSFTQAASTLNVENITLSATGTYTALILNLVGSGTLTYNGKSTAAVTLLDGTPIFADTITCTSFVINGPTFNFTSGTLNPTTSFILTSGGFTLNGGTLGTTTTFTQTSGPVTLNSSYSLTVTGTYTLTAGALTLADGVTLTTGIFSSNNSNTRSIAFGSASAGNINLTHTTAATVVLSMATLTGFTYTGPGGFTVADMANTRTLTYGTTGGSISNAVNLTFTSGASVATITTAGWFKTLDFGTTSFTIAATSLNLINLITSSSSGVLTALTATMRDTGYVVTTNRIGPLIINHSGTTTMATLATNLITSLTVTSGNLVIDANSGLNCTTTATLNGGTLLNYEGFIQCTIFTIAGSTFVLNAGSVTPSVSFVITSGSFTLNYSPAGGLATVPTFTHTAGTVQFNYSYALTATGTYTFTAGTLSINDDITLSTGIFSSTNANTRTINFGLTTNPGYISLTHTTAATVVLSMAIITGLTVNAKGKWDGTTAGPTQVAGGFKSETTVTRTFTCGTTGGNSDNAPCLYVTGTGATQLPTFTTGSWFGDFSIYNLSTMTIAATSLNINSLYGAGYYFSLNTTSMSISFRGSGFINYEGNIDNTFGILGAVTINHSGTTSMVYNLCAATSVAFTAGTLECRYWVNGGFNGYGQFVLTGAFTQTGGSWYNNAVYIYNCTTYTINGATVSFNSGSVTATTSVVLTSGSFTYNGGTLSAVPLFTHTNGTATFNYNYSLAVTGTYTLTAGTLTLANGVTLNTGIFSSTGAGIRSIGFGSTSAGNINLTHTTAATVVLNMAALGGFSYTGLGGFTVADMANTRTFSVGNTSGGSITTAPNLTFTTGSSIPTLTTASWFNNLDFGTTSFAIAATSLNITANLTLSSSGTFTSLTAVMVDTGTATLTTNGKTIAALTINGPAGVFTFAGIVTVTGALTLTSGTIYTPYAINSGSFASTGTATRSIIGTNITYTVSGAGATAFSNASGTGLTMTGLVISMTNAAAKTFAGGGGTYPVLNNGGAGALTISGSNTFDTISNSVQPTTFTFTIGTTQTVNNFNVAGIAGSLVTINSSTAATAATLSKASGTVYGSYLSIRDSTATGGATWYAGPTSTNTSNNTGWIFARLPIVTFGSLTMDTTDGGITISDDPIPV